MQTLYPKDKKTGATITVKIIRSFQDGSGKHIYLHHNGTYGDITGVPIKSADELNILPKNHRQSALVWWDRIGKKQSEAYYAAQAQQEETLAGDYQERLAADEANSLLDSILYSRKAKQGAVTDPKPWLEYGFAQRPDWWGQAENIKFGDCTYIMQKVAAADNKKAEE